MEKYKQTFYNKDLTNINMSDASQKEYSSIISSINKVAYLLTKHDSIRLKHWLDKLAAPVTNSIWKQNRNLYLRILLQMTTQGQLQKPFNQSPPQGPLPRLTLYDIPYPIRQKLSEQQLTDKNTPSHHKIRNGQSGQSGQGNSNRNSIQCSRKNSFTSTLQHKKSLSNKSVECKKLQCKKKILFQDSVQIQQNAGACARRIWENCGVDKENVWVNGVSRSVSVNKGQRKQDVYHGQDKQLFQEDKNSTCKFKFQEPQTPTSIVHQKGKNLLKKSLLFLAKHAQNLQHSIKYKNLLQKIVWTGDKLGQNFRQLNIGTNLTEIRIQNTLNSNDSKIVQKYNERIKDKLWETDRNTLEFMSYLNSIA